MKTILASILLVLLDVNILPTGVFAGTETNGAYTKIEQAAASNDVQGILQTLPEVERLWPQDPATYCRSVKYAAIVLGGAATNPEAKHALLTLFDKILDKTSPTNNEQAIAYFDLKSKTILYYFGFDDVRRDKSRLIAVAKFVGEVRARMIPNYANRGTKLPGREILQQAGIRDANSANSITNPVLKNAYEKAVMDNKQDLIMNDLQRSLRSADITFHLAGYCSQFPSSDPQNEKFIQDIISNAKLRDDEIKKYKLTRHTEVKKPLESGDKGCRVK